MPKLTGGQAVVQSLEAEGAQVAYGVLGSHLMPTYDALLNLSRRAMKIRPVIWLMPIPVSQAILVWC